MVPDNLAAYLTQQKLTSSNLAFQQSFNACNLNVTSVPCTKYVTASQDGLPAGLRNTYKGDFQPRVSIAYRPFNDTKTVIRGGFGVYTMTNLGPLSFNNSGNPTSNLHTYTGGVQFPATAPPTVGVQYGGGSLDQGVDPNYRDPQSNQYNLTVERALTANDTLRVSFVGMHTYRLNITEDLNQIPASTTPYNQGATAGVYVDSRAPYQNWDELYSTFNHGKANYKALEIEGSRRMSHGLYYNANYTPRHQPGRQSGRHPLRLRRRGQLRHPHHRPLPHLQRLRQPRRHAPPPLPADRHLPDSIRPGTPLRRLQQPPARRLHRRLGPRHRHPARNRPLAHPPASARPSTPPTPTSRTAAPFCGLTSSRPTSPRAAAVSSTSTPRPSHPLPPTPAASATPA